MHVRDSIESIIDTGCKKYADTNWSRDLNIIDVLNREVSAVFFRVVWEFSEDIIQYHGRAAVNFSDYPYSSLSKVDKGDNQISERWNEVESGRGTPFTTGVNTLSWIIFGHFYHDPRKFYSPSIEELSLSLCFFVVQARQHQYVGN